MRKRRNLYEAHEEQSQDRWLVSYADFITLLFAFFTVLYATSERDMEKTKAFQEAAQKFLVKAGAFGGSGDQIQQGEKYNSPIEPPIQTFKQNGGGTQELQSEVESILEESFSPSELDRLIIDIFSDEYGVRIILAGDQLFAEGSNKIKKEVLPSLEKVGGLVRALDKKTIVEGHSSLGNNPQQDRESASSRANNLIDFFVKDLGVSADKLISMSYGSQRPLVEENSKMKNRLNNRIELRVLIDETPF